MTALATLTTSCTARERSPRTTTNLSSRDALLEQGRQAAQAGAFDAARQTYARLLVINARDDEARTGLARLDAWQGAYAVAAATYREVLSRHPTDIDVRAGLVDVLIWAQRWEEAGFVLTEAPNPHHPTVLGRRARLAYVQGNVSEARRLIAQGERVDPKNAELAAEKARIVTQWASITPRVITSNSGAPMLGQTDLRLSQAVHRLRISFESEQGARATSLASGWAYGAMYGVAGAWTFAPGWTGEVRASLGAPAVMVPVARLETQLAMQVRPWLSSVVGYSFRRFADDVETHGVHGSAGYTFRDKLRLDATYWLTHVQVGTSTDDSSSRWVQAFGLSGGRTITSGLDLRGGYAHGAEAERSPAVFQLLDLVNDSFFVGVRITPAMFVSIEPVYTLVLRGRPRQSRQLQHSFELGLVVRR